jgi:hypothetical protein
VKLVCAAIVLGVFIFSLTAIQLSSSAGSVEALPKPEVSSDSNSPTLNESASSAVLPNTFTESKPDGVSMSFTIQIDGVEGVFSGTVLTPMGDQRSMNVTLSESGVTLEFLVSATDPQGNYIFTISGPVPTNPGAISGMVTYGGIPDPSSPPATYVGG